MAAGPILAPGPMTCDEPVSSFYRWATDISGSVGPNWRNGLMWEPTDCTDSHTFSNNDCDDCDEANDGATPADELPLQTDPIPDLICTNPAFTIYTGLRSSDDEGVLIKTLDELRTMALDSLKRHIPHRMARALVTENLAGIATDLTGGIDPVSFARAVGLILTSRNCETWFTVPETAVPYLIQEGLVDLSTMTLLGHPMIAVPTNTAPTTNGGATGFWVYGHGPVEYVQGEPYVNGGEEFTAGGTNRREAYARIEALIRIETCRVYAVAAIDPSC